ncbi:MAG: hypothetical protein ACJAUP_002876 [Cellvibrionaceae bacterium]|jgi:hypothetical protein
MTQAYVKATGQRFIEPRLAWRWLHKLMFKLSDFRTFLNARISQSTTSTRYRTLSLQHLLPTLSHLMTDSDGCFCSAFQDQSHTPLFKVFGAQFHFFSKISTPFSYLPLNP